MQAQTRLGGLMILIALTACNHATVDPSISAAQLQTTSLYRTLMAPSSTPTVIPTLDTATSIPTSTVTAVDTATPIPTMTPTITPTHDPSKIEKNADWIPVERDFNGVTMVEAPAGCFLMGTPDDQIKLEIQQNPGLKANFFTASSPQNKVCFTAPFWIDKTEVTHAQYKQFGGTAKFAGAFNADQRAMSMILWSEARDFCVKRGARLPTEAE